MAKMSAKPPKAKAQAATLEDGQTRGAPGGAPPASPAKGLFGALQQALTAGKPKAMPSRKGVQAPTPMKKPPAKKPPAQAPGIGGLAIGQRPTLGPRTRRALAGGRGY